MQKLNKILTDDVNSCKQKKSDGAGSEVIQFFHQTERRQQFVSPQMWPLVIRTVRASIWAFPHKRAQPFNVLMTQRLLLSARNSPRLYR